MGDQARLTIALALVIAIASVTDGKEVDAKDVMDAIQNHVSASFDGCNINGDLDLSGSQDRYKHISTPININNSIINGSVYFRDAVFHEKICFSNTHINGIANFSGSHFNGVADFAKTKFNNISYFDLAEFQQAAYFNNSTFNGTADFSRSLFNGTADFAKTEFNNISYFDYAYFWQDNHFANSTFKGIADFSWSQFYGIADFAKTEFNNISYFYSTSFEQETHFEDSTFNSTVDFNRSQFNGDIFFGDYSKIHNGSKFIGKAYFELARFDGYASFMGSNFSDGVDFWQSDFGDYVDFGEAEFHNATSFNWAAFKKQAFFSNSTFQGNADFYGSQFESDAMFDGAKFPGNLTLNWTRYKKMYIRWNSITKLISDDAGYMSLIKNFKDLGYFDDADDCYYRFRVEQLEHKYPSWTSIGGGNERLEQYLLNLLPESFDFLAKIFYGYGVKPLYPLIWSIVIILLFGFIWMIGGLNATADNQGIFEGYGCNQAKSFNDQPAKMDLWRVLQSLLHALNFSVIVFLSGTKLFIDPPNIPNLQKFPKTLAKSVFIAERVLGAFFSILLFIAINATVVRQIG